jgi:hypothetical protein
MTRFLSFAFALALFAGGAPGLSAQFFTGTAPTASDTFPLQAGLVVVELEHRGTGQFRARLLDQRGAVVEELAGTTGTFTGSRAVQIPRADQYLLDVVADGEWQVRIRRFGEVADDELEAHPELERARTLGREVANDQGVLGWFGGGFLAGAVAGPVGSVAATVWARRDPPPPPAWAFDSEGPVFDQIVQESYDDTYRMRRQRAALRGSLLGTAVLAFVIIRYSDLARPGGVPGDGSPPDIQRVPILRFQF